jgi:hypothetical protein
MDFQLLWAPLPQLSAAEIKNKKACSDLESPNRLHDFLKKLLPVAGAARNR